MRFTFPNTGGRTARQYPLPGRPGGRTLMASTTFYRSGSTGRACRR